MGQVENGIRNFFFFSSEKLKVCTKRLKVCMILNSEQYISRERFKPMTALKTECSNAYHPSNIVWALES